MRENFFDLRSIHFRWFRATLVLVAEKPPPPPRWGKFFWPQILSISGNFEQLWFWWQKSPPQVREIFDLRSIISCNFEQLWFWWQKSLPQVREIFLTSDLSISCNFQATLVLVVEKPPPPMREIFLTSYLSFQAISSNLVLVAEKPTPPPRMRKFFWPQIYPFQAFRATLVLVAEKPPSPNEGIFWPRSIHFRQFQATLVLVAEKPSPQMREIFLTQIYPFQAISSNFGFGGRKAHPPTKMREIFFDLRSIHFRQFRATLVLVAEKPPSPMRGIFLTSDLSISGNFEQLWFWWQKSPPPRWEIFLTSDLSISCNFKQLCFVAEKPPPPPKWGKFFDLRSVHFRQFQATLVLVAEKPPPLLMREIFLTSDLSISGNFEQLWFWWQKAPPLPDEGNFFDLRSIHFRQFRATLVLVAEKPPLMREIFLTSDLSISGNF